jgi:hypothetical protein
MSIGICLENDELTDKEILQMIPYTNSRFASRLFAVLAVCTCSFFVGTPIQAQPQPTARSQNPAEIHKHFQSAIDALAAKWHIAIVAESAPIMEKAGVTLSASLPEETVDQAVARIAAAFDYSVKRHENVFILNKLFTDPNDLPDVTLEEAEAALGDILQILPSVDEKYLLHGIGAGYAAMPKLLTREQLEAFNHGGVSISSLTEAQRDEAWRLCNAMEYSQLVDEVEDAAWFVQSAISHDPQFHWKEISPGFNEFGFDADAMAKLPSGERQRVTVLKPLSHPMGSTVCRDGFAGCCIVMKDIRSI